MATRRCAGKTDSDRILEHLALNAGVDDCVVVDAEWYLGLTLREIASKWSRDPLALLAALVRPTFSGRGDVTGRIIRVECIVGDYSGHTKAVKCIRLFLSTEGGVVFMDIAPTSRDVAIGGWVVVKNSSVYWLPNGRFTKYTCVLERVNGGG